MTMVYNFRFDREATGEVLRRLETQRVLSQGWGGGDKGTLSLLGEDFITECKNSYELPTTRIPSSIVHIRHLRDGDILVTPHLPENGKVSIHVVGGDFPDCYEYMDRDPNHLNHLVKVRESFGLDGRISIYNVHLIPWSRKLTAWRLPIIPIPDWGTLFEWIITEVKGSAEKRFDPSELADFLDQTRSNLLGFLREKVRDIRPSGSAISFEAVCKDLLVSHGYQIEGEHIYDKRGGDIDLRCTLQRSDVSPFESGERLLFVQVKKHKGTTDVTAVEQLKRMMKEEPQAEGCVISLAEGFSKDAIKEADKNGILLIDGRLICDLLLQRLAGGAFGMGPHETVS